MQSTQSLQTWLRPIEPTSPDGRAPTAPAREHDAHLEVSRLRHEIEQLVRDQRSNPRDAIDSALESVTRLQIVTANIEACRPPSATYAGSAMVALADEQLRGHTDAIERGMTYTADNQLRLLHEQRPEQK